MTTLAPSCLNGHNVTPGFAYCPTCGLPASAGAYDTGNPFPAFAPETSAPQVNSLEAQMQTRLDRRRQERAGNRSKRLVIGGIAAVAVAAGVAVGAVELLGGGTPETTVRGTFMLVDATTASSNCVGQDGYNDIEPGTTVILTNQDGKIMGSSALGEGTANEEAGTCVYHFSMANVPENADQYAVEVSHRGKVVDSRAQMQKSKWKFFLSLGD